MLLTLTERDGEVDSKEERMAVWPGLENPISSSKEMYVRQNDKDKSFFGYDEPF